jgi:hypothetical protein
MTTGGLFALDVATTTGFAYGMPGARPSWGHFRSGRRGAASGEVLSAFSLWLAERCLAWRPHWIVFEAPYIPRTAPARIRTATGHIIATVPAVTPPIDINVLRRLIAMCGLVEMIAHDHRIHCREAAANVICRHFTGRGSWGSRANKKAATQKMCGVYGWPGVSEDEADALALWVYAEAVLFPKASVQRGAGPLFVSDAGWEK